MTHIFPTVSYSKDSLFSYISGNFMVIMNFADYSDSHVPGMSMSSFASLKDTMFEG